MVDYRKPLWLHKDSLTCSQGGARGINKSLHPRVKCQIHSRQSQASEIPPTGTESSALVTAESMLYDLVGGGEVVAQRTSQ